MKNKVRWGIIGAGRIAKTFAADIRYTTNAELVAVAARRQRGADEFAEEFKLPKAYQGYDKLFADKDIDAIYVATPHTAHLLNCVDIINAGKAVLCEKPFTINSTECEAIVSHANFENGTQPFVMEAMWTHFLPAIQKAQQWIAEGRIGKLRHIKADFGYPLPYDKNSREYNTELAGGCLLEMGIYPVALTWLFYESFPTRTYVSSQRAPNGVENEVMVQWDFGDQYATIATSFRCKLQNWAYLIGEEGYIAIPDFWRAKECSLYQLDERIDHFADNRLGSGFEFEIEHASKNILAGEKESDIVSLADSLAFQQLMDLVRAKI